ncbi:MAG: hypothetical protein KKD44_12800 [Proteobacteria bacterium]|nr:hypothetical protein [Pseudomonadota bacterium]
MKNAAILIVLFLAACTSGGSHPYTNHVGETAAPEWSHGEKLSISGTIWPSAARTKYYITTIDGKSAHLKGDAIDRLKPGTKVMLHGRVEYVNSFGTAGASDVAHTQTFFYVNVSDYKIINDAAWDIEFQNAVDPDKPDYSIR